MRKLTFSVAAVCVMTCGGSYAEGYSRAHEKQSRCQSAGELAKSFHGADTETLRARAADIDQRVKKRQFTKLAGEETKYILFLGKTANSPEDAYMRAWSWCMDQKK